MVKMITPTETRNDPLIHRRISRSPVNTESIFAMTPDKDKKVTGTFVNIENPGQPAKISCKLYRGHPYFSQTMEDNQRYTILQSETRFINEECQYEEHGYLTDDRGNPLKTGKKKARYKFMIEHIAA